MRLFLLLIFIGVLFLPGKSDAQIFGGTAPKIHWKQMNLSHARIIYPDGIDSVAIQVANNIRVMNRAPEKTIGGKRKLINIVLRNENLVSNGYVSLSPFRSEFYLIPPQNAFQLGSLPWPDLLSVHEYRHAEQYSNFDIGLSHTLKSIFGQPGQALANAASIPDWFFEGDAVYQETNFTKQGRGSLPYFYNGFRSLWKENKNYSWMKLRNGSYLDFVPDKYILGFMLTSYGREKFGIHFWQKVTKDAASFKSLFYPFQSALKEHSGMKYSVFRDSAFLFFKNKFNDKARAIPSPDYHLNEEFPYYEKGGALVFIESSVKSIPSFILKKNSKEKKIRTAGYMTDPYFSYRNGKIVYASRRADIRWGYKGYNEIQILDLKTGKQKRITKKTSYFSPDINEAGDRLVAVHLSKSSTTSLDILDATNGKRIKTITQKGILNYSYPKIYGDTIISGVSDTLGKMSLMLFDLSTDSSEFLIPFSDNVIGFPILFHDTLYYSSSYKTNDELFAYSIREKKLFMVHSNDDSTWKYHPEIIKDTTPDGRVWDRKSFFIRSKDNSVGKYHPAIKNDTISWSTFTSQGLRLHEIPISRISYEEISWRSYSKVTSSFGLFSINNINSNLLYRREDSSFTSKKYSKLSHPFNFYGLIPGADDPVYSLSLEGENILNTIQSEIKVSYDRSNRSKVAGASIAYGGWFPVIVGGVNYRIDNRILRSDSFFYYNSLEPYAGFYIPLNFSKGRNFTMLTFGSNFLYNQTHFQKPFRKRFKDFSFSYLSNYLSFSNQSQVAAAQVLPRFGQSLFLNYKLPVSNVSGFQWLGTARLYLPGIGLTHSFNITASYSQKDTLRQINFSNPFPFARGYQAVNLNEMTALQFNYQLPLLYPEKGFANIVYLSRIRSNFFYDQTSVNDLRRFRSQFRSAGLEMFFDTKWWNQALISFGIRYSRLLDEDIFGAKGNNRWEVILPVNIFNN